MLNVRRSQRAANPIKSGQTVPELAPSYDWRDFLKQNPTTKGVPAWCFNHVPLSQEMKQIVSISNCHVQVQLKEEEYPEEKYVQRKTAYWISNPVEYYGLMSKIVYELAERESCEEESTRFINFITEAKSIGYTKFHMDTTVTCYPKFFKVWEEADRNGNWSSHVNWNLRTCKNTIPIQFTKGGELNGKYESRFKVGQLVEALDKSCISQMRVAEVIRVVGGRVHFRYWNSTAKPGEADFVCHDQSQNVFPSGWCHIVGHDLSSPSGYISPILDDGIMMHLMNYDHMPCIHIREGMWLEIVDPLNPSIVTAAQISKVLKCGYLMVTIDRPHSSTTKCFHITSPLLINCGSCKKWKLQIAPPISYKGDRSRFCWKRFLREVNGSELNIGGFHKDAQADFGYLKDMKLEAVDLMEPSHICVATVSEAKGRLLRIAFDGWGKKFDQWMVMKSTDLFPMGWCEVNQYPLRAPRAVIDNGAVGLL